MDTLERRGLTFGFLFGLAAGAVVVFLPNPSNVTALRTLGSPLLYLLGLVTLVFPPAGFLYYAVVPVQWTLVGWLLGFLLARRHRQRLAAALRAPNEEL